MPYLDVSVLRFEVLELDPALIPRLLGALGAELLRDVAENLEENSLECALMKGRWCS